MNSYSETLKAFRQNCRLSQEQVSQILGINRTTYTGYEIGKTKPDFDTIIKLCDIFGITVANFTDYYLKLKNKSILASDKPDYEKAKSGGERFVKITADEEILLARYRLAENKEEILRIIKKYEDKE
ncbi:hypothetical protein SDC9_161875 [bioreactor metagenome]|uniref:HTH cro/C1-type domain-containing protein n=1 Tax=bioreactor metagenome TaxID=1076179 RepID=A0A645FJG2_9ZZZZ